MKLFKYKANDANGYSCAGTIKAADEEDARRILEKQGKKVQLVEEDHEATTKVTPRTLEGLGVRPRNKGLLWEILGYAMPAGAMVVAILGIVIASKMIKPPAVQGGAQEVIEQYLAHEHSGAYENQFDLLSPKLKEFYGTAAEYVRKKKQSRAAPEGGVFQFGKTAGTTEIESSRMRAHYEVKLLRMEGMARVDFFLVPSKGKWTIDAMRDPAAVEYYLGLLDQEKNEESKRRTIVAFKTQTQHSDLEIEKLLQDYRKAKRKKEIGGDDIFSI